VYVITSFVTKAEARKQDCLSIEGKPPANVGIRITALSCLKVS